MPYIIEKTFNSEIFTKVGNPTITADGIASGFGDIDYIKIANPLIGATKYSIKAKFTLPSTISGYGYVFADTSGTTGLSIYYDSNNVIVRCASQTTVNSIGSSTANSVWKVEVIYDNETAIVNYTKNGVSGTKTLNMTGYTDFQATNLFIGRRAGGDPAYFKGSIDLKQFSITVDGKVVLNGTTSKEIYVLPSIQELKDYYSNTLIVQYHDQPKAKQTIEMLVYLVFSEMLLFQVQNAFNWKTAVGKQLDIIGQWVGVSRTFNINLLTEPKLAYPQYDRLDPDTTSALQGGYSDYESFDTLQGGQLRYSDIQTTTNNLNDDNYRIIIGLKIIFNSINHTAKAIDDAIWEYFNHEVYTVWTDNTLTYYYPSNLAQVMLFADYKGVLPAPTGVTVQLTEI